jgi:chromosome segregation ATPase
VAKTPEAKTPEAKTPEEKAPEEKAPEDRMLAMLEQVNQLLAAQQHDGANASRPSAVPPVIAEQLQLRAAELDRRDAAMQSRAQMLYALEERLGRRDDDLRVREQEWVRRSAELAARRREWAGRLRRHRQAAETRQTLTSQATQLGELVSGVAESFQSESAQVRALLLETVTAIQETLRQNQAIDPEFQRQLEDAQTELETLREQRETERQRREEVERELQGLREEQDQQLCQSLFSNVADEPETDSGASDLASLRADLAAAEQRIEELQSQNSDLAGRVATSSVNDCTSHEGAESLDSLPWEERKRMILARLEDEESHLLSEMAADDPESETTRDELQALRDIVHQTDREIMRRDAEIAELQQLLEQQSATVGDVAVGAAAIAGMFDQDELIREEREKLQQLKSEWEEKLRNAEIEVSMERAKLARDRQELEKRNAELEETMAHQQRASQHESTDDEGKPVRRWLSRMGLSEE